MTGAADALSRVPLFGSLTDRDRKQLAASMTERTFPAGAVISDVDRGGVGFFIVENGTATVEVGGKPRRKLGAGDYFGEIALIDGGMRSARITADTDLHCYGLTSWVFRPFVREHPDVAWVLMEMLAKRLREAEARDD